MSESEGDEESRSERLRRRRNSRSSTSPSKPDETAEQSEPSEKSDPSKPGESSNQDVTDEPSKLDKTDKPSKTSVKEEQVGTYMYLPKSQKKEVSRLYNVLKAEYEFEYDEDFEKNRHFYPLLVQFGLDSLDGLDASEIKDRLESI